MVNNQSAQLRKEFVRLFSKTFNERVDNAKHIRMLSVALVWIPYFIACVLIPMQVNHLISVSAMLSMIVLLALYGVYQYAKVALIDTIETMSATDIILNAHPAIAIALERTRKAQWADVDAAYAR